MTFHKSSSGLGLGLYLTKEIINDHKGTIEIESEGFHRGTTVTISLPLLIPLISFSTTIDSIQKDVKAYIDQIIENATSRSLTGIDDAITMELYRFKNRLFHLTANHMWSKYTFYDEKKKYIGTFDTMDKLLLKNEFLGNVLVVTHEQWLDKQNEEWKTKYKHW